MNKLIMMIGAAAVAVGAYADTYTDANNIAWTYFTNSDGENTVTLGYDSGNIPCISTSASVDAADIPWTFEKDGIAYTVTQIGSCAFWQCSGLTGTLAIPPSVTKYLGIGYTFHTTGIEGISSFGTGVTSVGGNNSFYGCSALSGTIVIDDGFAASFGNYAFAACTAMTGIIVGKGTQQTGRYFASGDSSLAGAWFKGRPTVSLGTQDYTAVGTTYTFQNCTALKVVLLGKNTEAYESGTFLNGVTGCKVFAPANGKWDSLNLGGTDNVKIPYGAGQNLDLAIDENAGTITATPTTEERLVQVLEAAPVFKAQFGLNTRINVTNTIEATAGTITAAMLNAVEFNTMLMTFAVKTQAQLDSVLAAVPQTAMLAIDPTGARQELTLPSDRAIWVWLAGDGKYTPKIKGLMIVFH